MCMLANWQAQPLGRLSALAHHIGRTLTKLVWRSRLHMYPQHAMSSLHSMRWAAVAGACVNLMDKYGHMQVQKSCWVQEEQGGEV